MKPTKHIPPGTTIAQFALRAHSPKLSRNRQEVFDVLRRYGPQTANEVVGKLPPSDLSNCNVRSRLTELVRLRRVVINRVVKDPVSGYRARQYRVARPNEVPPPVAEQLRLRRPSRAHLEAEIARLKTENTALKLKLSGAGNSQVSGSSISTADE